MVSGNQMPTVIGTDDLNAAVLKVHYSDVFINQMFIIQIPNVFDISKAPNTSCPICGFNCGFK